MTELLLAVAVFIASHSLPATPAIRRRLIGWLGRGGYMAGYSALSLGLLVWIGVAYRAAPYVGLWGPDLRLHWVPVLGMPVVCLLVVWGLLTANPLSLSLRQAAVPTERGASPQEPASPLLRVTRHPVLWGLALWAAVHLTANGDGASVILFGLMGGLALGGMRMMDRRRRTQLGEDRWRDLAAAAPTLNLKAVPGLLAVSGGVGGWRVLAVVGAAALLYGGLILAHAPVIGVSPLPW